MLFTGTAPTTRSQKVPYTRFTFFVTCIFLSHLDQGFGDKQMEHCCPGLHGGPQQKTSMKGNQVEERLRTVLVLISMMALSLARGLMTPALMRVTMFVKEVSE